MYAILISIYYDNFQFMNVNVTSKLCLDYCLGNNNSGSLEFFVQYSSLICITVYPCKVIYIFFCPYNYYALIRHSYM